VTAPLLTAQQVGALIGRSTKWVLNEAAAERIPSFKVGRAVRFDQDDIQAWLDTNRRGAVKKPRHLQTTGGQ
jgi:predicted DNA-binding transcriptional regulator AlpA